MTDVSAVIDAVMRQEDATLAGAIVNVAGDTGGTTRFGLASKWHPELRGTGYFTIMGRDQALALAEKTLNDQYAAPMRIGQIADPKVAQKFLSFGVNAGAQVAVKRMQEAVNQVLAANVNVDGICGPDTVAAINRAMPQGLLNAFAVSVIRMYADLCNQRAADRNELLGWVNRALA